MKRHRNNHKTKRFGRPKWREPLTVPTIKNVGYECWFDGAAWPSSNGPSASGALIKLDGVTIWEHSEYLGSDKMSNNAAEYAGCIAILEYLIEHQIHDATIYGDSNMVINQMTGVWKTRPPESHEKPKYYLPFYEKAMTLRLKLSGLTFLWLPRDMNSEADALSTKPLRERGYREDYYRNPHQIAAREMDEAFERAIS